MFTLEWYLWLFFVGEVGISSTVTLVHDLSVFVRARAGVGSECLVGDGEGARFLTLANFGCDFGSLTMWEFAVVVPEFDVSTYPVLFTTVTSS